MNMNIWSKEEEAEAIALIKEILSKGISPNQLIMQGFRADLVVSCSNQFNSGSAGEPSTSSVQIPTQPKAKRKRKKVGSKGKESSDAKPGSTNPANDTFTATSGSYINLSEMPSDGVDDEESDIQYADLLRQKVELERERTKLLRFERERLANGLEENGQSASSLQTSADSEKMQDTDNSQNTSLAMDPVQAMRQAALASMKRKRHSNGQQNEEEPSSKTNRTLGEVTGDSQPMMHSSSLPHSPFAYQGSAGSVISFEIGSGDYQSNTPPLNAPRGPRNALPRYHDFDAPSNMEAIQREIEAAEALQSSEDADLWATDDSHQFVDPRAASQRSKPLAYYDDVSVPAGQVDYSAPLPSLSSAPIKGATSQDRPSIPAGRNQGIVQPKNLSVAYPFAPFQSRRRSPFLQNGTDQRVVLDLSDDEGEQVDCDDVNEEHIAARQYRNDNARLMHSIFKAVINGDSFGSQSRSRNISLPCLVPELYC
ncbi:hypothetical protein L7F22_042035 [Adiantum nelumboides]|nr:hypothetical protein [Adiantum nelumboides]